MSNYKSFFLAILFIATTTLYGQSIELLKPPYTSAMIDSANRTSTFYIEGSVQGRDSGSVILYVKEKAIDTVPVKNGKFDIMGKSDQVQSVTIKVLGDYYENSFFIEHANLSLNMDLQTHKFIAKGGKENDLRNEFNHICEPASLAYNHDYTELNRAESQFDIETFGKYADSMLLAESSFIRNIEKQISNKIFGYYLINSIGAAKISYGYFDKRLAMLRMLPDSLKNTAFWKKVYNRIEEDKAKKAVKDKILNKKAFDFQLLDTSSKLYSLDQYKGKYVVLTYWASWCVPCIQELPLLRKIYATTRSDNVVFISISIDKDRYKWLKAASSNDIPWVSLLADEKTKNRYNITAVPNTFLISPKGKVMASDLSWDQLYLRLKNL